MLNKTNTKKGESMSMVGVKKRLEIEKIEKERAKAEDIEINLERVRKQYTNSKHLQVDVNRLKKLGII
jgi:hypothetical protein